jgi:hypothetical protein
VAWRCFKKRIGRFITIWGWYKMKIYAICRPLLNSPTGVSVKI